MNREIARIQRAVVPLLKKNKVKRAGIFGSYARGEQKKKSDIDMLIEFNGSLLDLAGIEIELKKALRKDVDLLTYGGLHPLLKKRILDEEVRIL